MLYVPNNLSKKLYISGLPALNTMNKRETGDWHWVNFWLSNTYKPELYIYGEGQARNTNHILGDENIILLDNDENLMGLKYEVPVYAAEHNRAYVDYLYYRMLKENMDIKTLAYDMDNYFPEPEDKEWVYKLLDKIEPTLTNEELAKLNLFKELVVKYTK